MHVCLARVFDRCGLRHNHTDNNILTRKTSIKQFALSSNNITLMIKFYLLPQAMTEVREHYKHCTRVERSSLDVQKAL